MYLSGLEILGFKSFAQKVKIEFKDGITAIVGPNGCGKSNIVDAIRWVLGEQKTAVLRSERMENVIFNGSGDAKPLGMAEVSLLIKNESRVLPLDYSEVIITRRLFRSGESQYLVNNRVCRLKDILDLTMDTGLGLNTYSVIELSMVESILNGKADDRRRIFEEAAGITKYKLRRKATFRKLEATEKDLIRIDDILSEVDKTVRSLHRQVEKARRYQQIANELKELEIKIATQTYSTWLIELDPLLTKLGLVQDEREQVAAQMAKYEAGYESARAGLLELEQRMNALQREQSEVGSAIHKDEEEALVAQERIRSLEEARLRFEAERNELNQRLKDLAERKSVVEAESQAIQQKVQVAEQNFTESKRKLDDAENAVSRTKAAYRQTEQLHFSLLEKYGHRRNEMERLMARMEASQQRLKEVTGEAGARQAQFDFGRGEIGEKQDQIAELEGRLQLDHDEEERLTELLQTGRLNLEALKSTLAEAEKNTSILEQRTDFTKRLLESYDDYPEAVRHIVLEENQRIPTLGTLANLIQVEPKYQAAVTNALGEAVSCLIVNSMDTALNGVEILTAVQKGQAAFLPMQESIGSAAAPVLNDLGNRPGVVGWLSELIQAEAQIKPLIQFLVKDFVLVQDLAAARGLLSEVKVSGIQLVTLAGEVITYWGLVRGGTRSRSESASILGRRAQLQTIEAQLEAGLEKIDALKKQIQIQSNEIADFENQIKSQRNRTRDLEAQYNELRVALGKLETENSSMVQLENKRKQEEIRLNSDLAFIENQVNKRKEEMSELEAQRDRVREDLKRQQDELNAQDQIRSEIAAETQEKNVVLVALQSESKSVVRELENIQAQSTEIEQRLENWQRDMENSANEIVRLTERIRTLRQNLEQLYQTRKGKSTDEEKYEDQHHAINQEMGEFQEQLRHFRNRAQLLSDVIHQNELRISELRLNIKNLSDRISTEFEHKLERQEPDKSIDLKAEEEASARLRQQLKGLGPVNLLALKEYERENERLNFLRTQREDLLKAKDNLLSTIDKINDTAREKFNETFARVRANFQQVFKNFFDDGKADIVIQDEGDPLESEIEIVATPGGKRVASISLMSGGEKTLTAISLLLSLYMVKPSPFCILDEVDAPLDDKNIHRFRSALRQFSEKTQFIVVTHNKLTMREADQLYGIAMEQKGISRVVSVKFDRENERIAYEAEPSVN